MLIEFFNIIISVVPMVVIGAFFSSDIEKSHREQLIMHDAVHRVFFNGSCADEAICEGDKIRYLDKHGADKHKVYIRRSSSLFKTKNNNSSDNNGTGEVDDGVLEDLYTELEKAPKANTSK